MGGGCPPFGRAWVHSQTRAWVQPRFTPKCVGFTHFWAIWGEVPPAWGGDAPPLGVPGASLEEGMCCAVRTRVTAACAPPRTGRGEAGAGAAVSLRDVPMFACVYYPRAYTVFYVCISYFILSILRMQYSTEPAPLSAARASPGPRAGPGATGATGPSRGQTGGGGAGLAVWPPVWPRWFWPRRVGHAGLTAQVKPAGQTSRSNQPVKPVKPAGQTKRLNQPVKPNG